MELNSDLAKNIINKLNSENWVSSNELIDLVCNNYADLLEQHQLYISQDPKTFQYSAGLYLGKSAQSYTKEDLLKFFIQFNNLSIELKQFLNILEYLKGFNYITGLRAQPNLTILNSIVWSKGNDKSQTETFFGVSDPELFQQLVSNHALSFKKTTQLDNLIKRNYLEEDEYRFSKSLSHSIWNLSIASVVGLIALITLFYTYKQLKNIETVEIEQTQFQKIQGSLDSIEFKINKLKNLDKLDLVKDELSKINSQFEIFKEELEQQTKKLNQPVKVEIEN